MKSIIKLLALILIVSCSNKRNTLEQYSNDTVKVAKQKITHPNIDFSLYIPKDWKWKIENYENENIISGIDAGSNPDKDGFIDIISIQKIKSFGNNQDLKSEYEYWLNLMENEVIASGQTDILNQKSYFIHTKSDTGTYGEAEVISFLIESKTRDMFYILTASASQTIDLKKIWRF